MNESSCLCKNCKKRALGCHTDCNDYKKYQHGLDKLKEDKAKFFKRHGGRVNIYSHYC